MRITILLLLLSISVNSFSQASKYKARNVYTILIDNEANLLVRGEPMTLEELSSNLTNFIINPDDRENLAVTPDSAIISLVRTGTSYDDYKQLCAVIQNVYIEIWSQVAVFMYGKPLDRLTKEERKAIFDEYPKLVMENNPTSFGTINFPRVPPPPPPFGN